MNSQEVLKKAMSNRQPISFQYQKIGRIRTENIENARVILMSTDGFGKDSVMVDLPQNNSAVKNIMPSWRYFDMNDMLNIEILNNQFATAP